MLDIFAGLCTCVLQKAATSLLRRIREGHDALRVQLNDVVDVVKAVERRLDDLDPMHHAASAATASIAADAAPAALALACVAAPHTPTGEPGVLLGMGLWEK